MDAHPEAGAVGCKILNPDGTFAPESRRSFPTPAVAFYRMTGLSRLFPKSRVFGRYNLSYLTPDEATEVDALSGSCMVVRAKAIEQAGMFDEDFFMYGEDLDWCYRIQQAGWSIHYTPDTQIIHYKGESTKKGELRDTYCCSMEPCSVLLKNISEHGILFFSGCSYVSESLPGEASKH